MHHIPMQGHGTSRECKYTIKNQNSNKQVAFFYQQQLRRRAIILTESALLSEMNMMRTIEKDILNRTTLLAGDAAMERIGAAKVIVFGVGGVGSWCAESLVRSGIRHLTIVDSDRVCITNVNRQAMATTKTVGRVKVDAMKERLMDINPEADVTAIQEVFSADTADTFHLEEYDYIVDAIDSLKDKLELIVRATDKTLTKTKFYSSMGAALKMDPTQVHVSEFWQVDGCPLAAVLRRRMRKQKRFPGRKFQCVWSPEVLPNLGQPEEPEQDATFNKAQINGTTSHITAIYGFTLAGLIIQDLYRQ